MSAKILQLSRYMKLGKESKPASFLEKVIVLQHPELDVFYYVRHNTNKIQLQCLRQGYDYYDPPQVLKMRNYNDLSYFY
jgi:hypothetical protein